MAIWWFLGPAAALSVLVVGLAALALKRGAQVSEADERRDLGIYRDQLREIERDSARGLIPADEAERLRAETARRLLDADRRGSMATRESPKAMKTLALVLFLLVPAGAAALYAVTGAPGYTDQPLATRHAAAQELREARPAQAALEAAWAQDPDRPAPPEVDAQYSALMAQLRNALESRPDDQRGLRLLAVNEAGLGNHAAAADAWVRLIDLQGAEAPVADLEALAESLILAAGGLVSPEAEITLEQLLRRDPANGTARYYLGLMFAQTDRPDLTFRLWRGLLEDSISSDPWVPNLRAALPDLAAMAGVRYSLPSELPATRGPTAADVEAMAGMAPEEQQAMIGGMVEGLAARLANQGGPAEDWAQLIRALAVLGEEERARAIWAEAQVVFTDQADGLTLINATARDAGLGE